MVLVVVHQINEGLEGGIADDEQATFLLDPTVFDLPVASEWDVAYLLNNMVSRGIL